MAAQAGATVYGKINVGLSQADTGASTGAASALGITSHDSRLGFKGSEDLGGGLTAFFKMETEINVDEGAGNTFQRDKYLGIKGGFGEIKMGEFNTPYKNVFGKMDIFADSIGDVTGSGSHGELDDRHDNMLGYKGTFGPITLDVSMDFQESDAQGSGAVDDGMAVGVTYKAGSIMVSAGIVDHNNGEGAGDGADEGTRLGFQMKLGAGKLNVLYEDVDMDGSTTTADHDVTTVQYGHNMGKNMFGISYTMKGGDGSGNDSTQTTLAMHHKLSKKTKVAIAYTAVDNDENSSSSGRIFNTDNFDATGVAAGDDPSQMGVMITHSF